MTSLNSNNIDIRPIQYRDLEAVERLLELDPDECYSGATLDIGRHWEQVRACFGLLKLLGWFPNPYRHLFCTYVAHQNNEVLGAIQVSPFNHTRTTWRIDRLATDPGAGSHDVGTALLRYCLDTIWEARTWMLEVDVSNPQALGLYRQNGFQPLAQLAYWNLSPETLVQLADREPDLPNLLPANNADAQLLYQLDTVSMPPLVRQMFDRHVSDFKTHLSESVLGFIKQWAGRSRSMDAYVFEPQRKAAIGYFQIKLSEEGTFPHSTELTVHPAYTWLYPELLSQMARITREFPTQALQVVSTDYQSEREEYLTQVGATPVRHTLLMSRSVWHKLREAKPVSLESLQLSEVLGSLQPARKPIPTRIWLHPHSSKAEQDPGKEGDRSSRDNGHPQGDGFN